MSAPTGKSRLGLKLGIVLLVLAAAAVAGFYRLRPTAYVAVVKRGPAADLVAGSVIVHAQKDLQEIKSDLPGRVVEIDPRQLGQPFQAGEMILRLDASDLERAKKEAEENYTAALDAAKIKKQSDPRLEVAKENRENARKLFERLDLSESQWKNAQRDYARVETDLALEDHTTRQAKIAFERDQAMLQRQIDKMTLRAPMDCILKDVMVAKGALIGSGTTVATYFSMGRDVIAKVGEEDIGRVKVGQPAKVRLVNTGDTYDATVTTILPFADADTQRYSVYLDVKTELKNLVPNSTGEASITAGERDNQPLIPRRALFNDDYVFVVNNGMVEKRKVSIGYRALNFAEVTGNLKEGERVIVDNLDQFRDGQRVKVIVRD